MVLNGPKAGRFLASLGRLPSDIDGDRHLTTCPRCDHEIDREDVIQDWTPTRGAVLVCRDCYEGREE